MKLTKKSALSCLLFMGAATQSATYTWGMEVPVDQLSKETCPSTELSKVPGPSLSKEEMMDELVTMLKDVIMIPVKERLFGILDQTLPSKEAKEMQKGFEYAFESTQSLSLAILKKVYMRHLSSKEVKGFYDYYREPQMVSFMMRWCNTALTINDHLRFGINNYNVSAEMLPEDGLAHAMGKLRKGIKKHLKTVQPSVENYARTQQIPWDGHISDEAWKSMLKGEFKISLVDFINPRMVRGPEVAFNIMGVIRPFNFEKKQVNNICDNVIVKMYKDIVGDYPEGIPLYDKFMKKYEGKVKKLNEKYDEQFQLKVMPLVSEKMDEYFK